MSADPGDSGQSGAFRLQYPADLGEHYCRLTEVLIRAKNHALTEADPLESVSETACVMPATPRDEFETADC